MQAGKVDRLIALDAIRGIASLIVVTSHLFLMLPENIRHDLPMWLRLSPLRLLINGHGSVILFFVLSGYVLAIPFLHHERMPFGVYLIKRICRIYIPFCIAILLASILFVYSAPLPTDVSSHWQHNEWGEKEFSLGAVIRHLAMTGTASDMWLDGVMWSLVVEMRVSIVFPLIVALCLNTLRGIVFACAIYCLSTYWIIVNESSFLSSDSFLGSAVVTLRFVPMFILGILLSKHHLPLAAHCERLGWLWRCILIAIAVSVFYLPANMSCSSFGKSSYVDALWDMKCFYTFAIDIFISLSSGAMIVLARGVGSKKSALTSAPILFLGKISYSLYLIHLPVMFYLFRVLWGNVDALWIYILTVPTCIGLAWIFYILVERPSTLLVRQLEIRR